MKPLLPLCSLLMACTAVMCSEPDSTDARVPSTAGSVRDGVALYGWAAPAPPSPPPLESPAMLRPRGVSVRGRRALCPAGSRMDCARPNSVTYSGVVFAALDDLTSSSQPAGSWLLTMQ